MNQTSICLLLTATESRKAIRQLKYMYPIVERKPLNGYFFILDFELKKVLLPPPLGNFADISYLEENFKPHLLRDVCTLCSGALGSDSLLHMLLQQIKEKIKMKV